MKHDRKTATEERTMEPLTKREIDLQMERVIAEVAGESLNAADDDAHPRWIDPGELVRRMSRYLVYN